jgi:pyruvate/2-oxoglutarate/acetoin dehydrogenase E1 component
MPEALATQINELTYIQAVNEALRWGLATYPEAILFGEDVAIPGGPYGASRNLLREFGRRVFDTPISEAAMVGAATGAAMRGLRLCAVSGQFWRSCTSTSRWSPSIRL